MHVLSTWALILVGGLGMPPGESARDLAARIDARLAARWAEAKIRPVPRSDDGEFLRRVSLDLVGKIPTAAEARDFLDDPNPEKRSALVDRLLDSPGYVERSTALWGQLLFPGGQGAGTGFESWLRKKVVEEAGYDRIVREILAARLGEPATMAAGTEPSPAGFYQAKEGKPEVVAADSARIFLGLRLECAQCHHHPFARWKREEFWGYAAFFAGIPRSAADDAGTVAMVREDAKLRELTIPGTTTKVGATHLDRSPPGWRPRAGTREVLAEWMTAPSNPYFARAAVNRVWARYFGLGLIEPVDDLDADDENGLGGLLGELAVEFRDHGHDLKFLTRALLATRAYQLASAVEPGESAPPPLFARMPVRGMSPAQFVDSLAQATGSDLGDARTRFLLLFANRDEKATEAQTSILQALTLMNGTWMSGATDPGSGETLGAVAEAPYLDTAGRIEALYLATLTRRPRSDELTLVQAHVDRGKTPSDRTRLLADVFWALLNGPEFRLNH